MDNGKMKIFSLLDELKKDHSNHTVIRKNGTLLFNPGKIPKAQHILYQPLTSELIDEYLSKAYKNTLPVQYKQFLGYSNGMDLFMFKIFVAKFAFAGSNITIYGLPRTQPFGRPADMEEPFDIRIEDLRRHANIPDTWLKVGTYRLKYESGGEADMFIDCDSQRVFTTKRDQCGIEEQWDSFDFCLCDLFQRAQNSLPEYRFK
ncbi:MAG: hypothetical protein E7603_01585 [Ruminococcaceae bacterium]|nr:hypothetical protein [Oscillospiraceae bacterium]